jgi:hypothetical protein
MAFIINHCGNYIVVLASNLSELDKKLDKESIYIYEIIQVIDTVID